MVKRIEKFLNDCVEDYKDCTDFDELFDTDIEARRFLYNLRKYGFISDNIYNDSIARLDAIYIVFSDTIE